MTWRPLKSLTPIGTLDVSKIVRHHSSRAERRFRALALLNLRRQRVIRGPQLRRPLLHRAFELLPSEAKGSLCPLLARAYGIGDKGTNDESDEPRQISG